METFEISNKPDSVQKIDPGRIISLTLVILGVALAFYLLFRFRLVAFSLFEAIVFSTAITPVVDWLHNRKIPRSAGVAIVFGIIILLLLIFIVTLAPIIGEQSANVSQTIGSYYGTFRQSINSSPSFLIQRIGNYLPEKLSLSSPVSPDGQETLDTVAQALSYTNIVFRSLFTFIAVLLLTIYWTLDQDRILRSLVMIVPIERRDETRQLIQDLIGKVGAYIRGLVILCLIVGGFSIIAYIFIGLPYAILLGLLAGLMEAIPLVGPVVGAIPAFMVAVSMAPDKVIWVLIATVVIQALENNLLVPRVMNQAVGVNPVVSLLAFAAFSSLFGLAGAILAIPLAVVLQILINRFVIEPSQVTQPPPVGRDSVSLLRLEVQELMLDVRKHTREKDGSIHDASDQIEDALEALANDLDSILAQEEIPAEQEE